MLFVVRYHRQVKQSGKGRPMDIPLGNGQKDFLLREFEAVQWQLVDVMTA